ncbi:MAG: thiamine phosphate synthase [Terriglobia bacterium]
MNEIEQNAAAPGIKFPRLYAILDAGRVARELLPEMTKTLLAAGVRLIQYRDKRGTSREMVETGRMIGELVQAAGGIFIVNDRADVAWAAGADGVHLGQEDLPAGKARALLPTGKLIGLSTHTLAQVTEADCAPVDYIAFGPVFATHSKERPDPVAGVAGLCAARAATRKPLVAIGGITLENAQEVVASGANSVAVIEALLSAADVGDRARRFLEVLKG